MTSNLATRLGLAALASLMLGCAPVRSVINLRQKAITREYIDGIHEVALAENGAIAISADAVYGHLRWIAVPEMVSRKKRYILGEPDRVERLIRESSNPGFPISNRLPGPGIALKHP
jgi:hypothetical protein